MKKEIRKLPSASFYRRTTEDGSTQSYIKLNGCIHVAVTIDTHQGSRISATAIRKPEQFNPTEEVERIV